MTHDQNPTDPRIDDAQQQRPLHLFLAHDSGKRIRFGRSHASAHPRARTAQPQLWHPISFVAHPL
jgi:hypothetical protein